MHTETDLLTKDCESLSLEELAAAAGVPWSLPGCAVPVSRFLGLRELNRRYGRIHGQRGLAFIEAALDELGIAAAVGQADSDRIPGDGGVVVVANHPYGILDGLLAAHVVGRVRRDIRILATSGLRVMDEVGDLLIPVDLDAGADARRRNARALHQALGWVREGGVLIVFPSGAISRPSWGHAGLHVMDPAWQENVGRLIQRAGVPVVPLFVSGHNSRRYQCAGLLGAAARLILQPRELLRQSGRCIEVHVGRPVGTGILAGHGSGAETVAYLRFRTYLLGLRQRRHDVVACGASPRSLAPITTPCSRDAVCVDVANLPDEQCLVDKGACQVFVARAEQIPTVLHEIGRLREVTFRAVGEGTGRAIDLDDYDRDYLHLFVWNREDREIVGAYRMGQTDVIIPRRGLAGLYSTHRFRTDPAFFGRLGPALELGRSFVQPRYQRNYSSLLLLWQGIGEFVARSPRYRRLYGMVSISNCYAPGTRELMAAALMRCCEGTDLGRYVAPTVPLRPTATQWVSRQDVDAWCTDVADVNSWVADLEEDLGGVPVLVRQYAKMGADFLGFNVDPTFGNTLDGMIVVDLMRTPRRQLRKMFGGDATARILGLDATDG